MKTLADLETFLKENSLSMRVVLPSRYVGWQVELIYDAGRSWLTAPGVTLLDALEQAVADYERGRNR